ncbi:hypothetical protein C2845_PM02G32950 [Panicum miliaceum]|uniref:Major facilitator superfamily (MFS) profile domain-containing protein n=1 Tax=Panicum miliaceum TaxID=4540 RepID=A0A3L6S3E6_PANMI|nr:hypothetical protein C2845_PM02G32950 [Panicum miliaceum]
MAGRRRQWTLALVSVAALLERADEALLPAVYREVGAALGASPTALGSLTMCRALVQTLCYPLATWAAARYDRARVVAAGAFLWAAATLLVGSSGSFLQMALARGFNGVGLAVAVPAIYSLVADYSDDTTRGWAFGWVVMAQTVGFIAGSSFGLLLAPISILGVPGWRLAFYVVALISVCIAALVWLLAADPRPVVTKDDAAPAPTLADLVREAKDVVRVPTFQLIVALGVAGSVPWSAFNFITMWLELIGFSHGQTSLIISLASIANLLGILFAGFLGDTMARRFPRTGRVALAQASTALTVPLAAALLLAFPGDPSAVVPYAAVCFAFGFTVSWPPVSTTNPIFAEIVPEKARTTVYALDRCFESVLASFGSPLVGILAERVFGYQPGTPGKSAEADHKNADALSKAIFSEIAVPVTICCLTYTALYWTYPADRRRAQMAALQAASEDQYDDCEASVVAHAAAADGLDQALLPGTRTG